MHHVLPVGPTMDKKEFVARFPKIWFFIIKIQIDIGAVHRHKFKKIEVKGEPLCQRLLTQLVQQTWQLYCVVVTYGNTIQDPEFLLVFLERKQKIFAAKLETQVSIYRKITFIIVSDLKTSFKSQKVQSNAE